MTRYKISTATVLIESSLSRDGFPFPRLPFLIKSRDVIGQLWPAVFQFIYIYHSIHAGECDVNCAFLKASKLDNTDDTRNPFVPTIICCFQGRAEPNRNPRLITIAPYSQWWILSLILKKRGEGNKAWSISQFSQPPPSLFHMYIHICVHVYINIYIYVCI